MSLELLVREQIGTHKQLHSSRDDVRSTAPYQAMQ